MDVHESSLWISFKNLWVGQRKKETKKQTKKIKKKQRKQIRKENKIERERKKEQMKLDIKDSTLASDRTYWFHFRIAIGNSYHAIYL